MELVLLAHQDDEFGCFSLLEKMVNESRDFKIIYLTSGAPAEGDPKERNLESIDVLGRIGVDPVNVFFMGESLNIADGALYRHLETAYNALLQLIGHDKGVNMVLCAAWEGGHHDHDAVYLLALTIAIKYQCMNESRQFPLYNGKNLPYMFFRVLTPLKENGAVFRERLTLERRFRYLGYCASYPSQYKTWIGLLPFVLLNYVFKGCQYTQGFTVSCIAGAPHTGSLLYERRNFCSREEFNQCKDIYIRDILQSVVSI
ncbi:MAG: LmbE family N-acetylglucosaminyl deacetylase [Paraglaciecola sp.]|jgi:LmbE family N-acetylglucosaminyl deacetylase